MKMRVLGVDVARRMMMMTVRVQGDHGARPRSPTSSLCWTGRRPPTHTSSSSSSRSSCSVAPPSPPRYEAVIFDMYGVLLPSPVTLATEFECQYGVPQGTLGRAIRAGGRDGVWHHFMRGQIGVQDFIQAFSRLCSDLAGCPVPIGAFYSALISGPMSRPIPVMSEAVHSIRRSGLKTALLTNNFLLPSGQPFMPLDPNTFDVVVQSVTEGVSKPDPQIFELCLNRLGVAPEHAIFLDDLIFNVNAAAHLGITTIQVTDAATAVQELEELLRLPLRTVTPDTSQRSTQPIRGQPPDSQPIGRHLTGSQPIKERLADYLRSQRHLDISEAVSLQQIRPTLHLLSSRGQQLLIRTQQEGPVAATCLDTELRVLKTLRGSGLPVPVLMHYCPDPRVIGGPFQVMEMCGGGGRVLTDVTLLGHSPSARRAVYEAMIDALCRIHKHTLHTHLADLPVLSVDQKVRMWTQRYRELQNSDKLSAALQSSIQTVAAHEDSRETVMERLCAWLPLHLPSKHTHTLLHGDYRVSSVVFHRDKWEVVCVMDWAHAAIGDPLLDVIACCSQLAGVSRKGFPSPDELIGQYCERMGQDMFSDWRFYMSLQLFCQAVSHQEEVAAEFQALQHTVETDPEHSDRLVQKVSEVERLAELAWDFATQEGFRLFNSDT